MTDDLTPELRAAVERDAKRVWNAGFQELSDGTSVEDILTEWARRVQHAEAKWSEAAKAWSLELNRADNAGADLEAERKQRDGYYRAWKAVEGFLSQREAEADLLKTAFERAKAERDAAYAVQVEAWSRFEAERDAEVGRRSRLADEYRAVLADCDQLTKKIGELEADAANSDAAYRVVAEQLADCRLALAHRQECYDISERTVQALRADLADARAECEKSDDFGTRAELARLKLVDELAAVEEAHATANNTNAELLEQLAEANANTREWMRMQRIAADEAVDELAELSRVTLERDEARREAEHERTRAQLSCVYPNWPTVFSWEPAPPSEVQCAKCEGQGRLPMGEAFVTHEMALDAEEPEMEGQCLGVEYAPCPDCGGGGVIPSAPPSKEDR